MFKLPSIATRTRWIGAVVLVLNLAVGGCGASLNDSPHVATASLSTSSSSHRAGAPNPPAALGGREANEAAELASVSNPTSHAYKIGPMDVIDVSVFQVPELSKTVQVGADGAINLPLVGNVQAMSFARS